MSVVDIDTSSWRNIFESEKTADLAAEALTPCGLIFQSSMDQLNACIANSTAGIGKTETMAANTMVAKPRLLIWDFFW